MSTEFCPASKIIDAIKTCSTATHTADGDIESLYIGMKAVSTIIGQALRARREISNLEDRIRVLESTIDGLRGVAK